MKKFKRIKDGEWVKPNMNKYLMGCCDCGLVHRLEFKVTRFGNVKFRAFRDIEATEQHRKTQAI